jgi:hypothetical protein
VAARQQASKVLLDIVWLAVYLIRLDDVEAVATWEAVAV